MSDMLGNRRLIARLDSVSSFADFDILYLDLQRRWTWGVRLFDNRSYYTAPDYNTGTIDRLEQAYRETGATGLVSYPFTRYHRLDTGLGYISREYTAPIFEEGSLVPQFRSIRDDFPLVSATFSGDNTQFKFFGPVSGRRYNVSGTYAYDLNNGGTMARDFTVDWREYFQLSSRTLLAARVFIGTSQGNRPNLYYFGGLNTLRGYDFRSIIGNEAAFANFEFRFPFIDVLATPFLVLQQVRGNLFFDIGGASYLGYDVETLQKYDFYNDGKLKHGKASVGYGVSFVFWGLELHWEFAKRYDLDDVESRTRTTFWIGQTF
jgi:outer membrane protein assembly factor BamA